MVVAEALGKAAKSIASARSVALACHIGPDGDALGSMLGFGIAARDAGKEVVASFGTPFTVPGNLSFLPTDLLVAPGDVPDAPEIMIVFDVGSSDRLGELSKNAAAAETLIVLDHHVTNDGFGDIAAIDPTAAATAELVMDLREILGWPITKEVANCLHTAIVTDTGRFQYTNTSPQTLQRAARLVEAGASPDEIGRHVYEEAPFGYLQAAGAALRRASLDPELAMVSTVLTFEDLARASIDWGDVDNLINTIRLAEEADVAVLAKVHDDGRVKMSLRSRGATDVGAIATELGGGGHRLASGFTFHGTADQAIDAVRSRIEAHR
jgi:phosphoesterase RecJ-like protein